MVDAQPSLTSVRAIINQLRTLPTVEPTPEGDYIMLISPWGMGRLIHFRNLAWNRARYLRRRRG